MSLNLVEYVRDCVDVELSEMRGMKSLLMDKETTSIISLTCPQSWIMKKEVYLFEDVSTVGSAVGSAVGHLINSDSNLYHLKCFVIVRNTNENLSALIKELSHPRYSAYYLIFPNKINETLVIKRLAEADINEVIKDIKEIYIDFLPLNENSFLIKTESLLMRFRDWEMKRCGEGLQSLATALGMDSPTIAYQPNSKDSSRLAGELKKEIAGNGGSTDGIVLILDRRSDPLAPIMMQWTYLALIHELIGFDNNKIKLMTDGKEQILTVSTDHDDFYKRNLFSNFGELGFTVKNLVDEYQKQMQGHSTIESISDIKEFITKYPEFKKMSGTVSKHVSVITDISNKVQNRQLMKLSALEQEIACSTSTNEKEKNEILKQFKEILMEPASSNFLTKDLFRVMLIFAIKFRDYRSLQHLQNQHPPISNIDVKELMSIVNFLGGGGKFDVVTSRQTRQFVGQNLIQEFKNVDNLYDQFKPGLKEVLVNLIDGRNTCLDLQYHGDVKSSRNIAVFMVGGFTSSEVAAVHDLNKTHKAKIVIGGTSFLNSDTYIQDLRTLSTANV